MVLHRKIFSPVQKTFSLVLLGSYVMGFGAGLSCCLENPDELPLRDIKPGDWGVVERPICPVLLQSVFLLIGGQAKNNKTLKEYIKKQPKKTPLPPYPSQYYVRDCRLPPGGGTGQGGGTALNAGDIDTLILSEASFYFDFEGTGILSRAYKDQGFLIKSNALIRAKWEGSTDSSPPGVTRPRYLTEESVLESCTGVSDDRGGRFLSQPSSSRFDVTPIQEGFSTVSLPGEWQKRSIEILVWKEEGRDGLNRYQLFSLLVSLHLLKKFYGIETAYIGSFNEVAGTRMNQGYIENIGTVRKFCDKEPPPGVERNRGRLSCICS